MSEDILVRLQFWYDQERAHYEAAPADEWTHCQTCALARDLADAIEAIGILRTLAKPTIAALEHSDGGNRG